MTALITPLDLSNTSTLTLKGHAQKTNETVDILNEFIANTSLSGQILTLNTYVNATFAKNTYVNSTFATTTYTNQYANASNMLLRLKTVDGSGSGLDADLLDSQDGSFYRNLANATGTIPDANLPARIKQVASTVTDANTIGASGWYFILNTGTNIPETDHGYILQITQNDGSGTNADVQFWFSANTDKVYKRQRWYSATWQAWKRCHLTEAELDARYLQIANLLTQIKTVDGSGSGLDADLLDGQQGTYYSNLANATGTIPDANLPARLKFGASPAVTDCNDAVLSGFYFTANNPANAPMTGYGYLIVAGLDAAGRCKQIWHQYQSTQPRSFERDQYAVGTWNDWVETTSAQPYLDTRYLAFANMTGTIANASLPGRLQAVATVITDWNSATENGWYKGNNATNAPPSTIVGTAWLTGRVECYAGTYVIQTVWGVSSSGNASDTKVARRACINGTWQDWYKVMISQAEMDSRYLGISDTATDSSALGGIAAANYARLNTSVTFSGLTVSSDVTSPALVSPSVNVIVSPTGAGNVYLRPNGRNSGTGQAVINSAGTLSMTGGITGATTGSFSGQVTAGSFNTAGSGSFATVTTSGAATITGGLTTLQIQSTSANLIVGGGGAIFFRPLGVGNATNQSYFTGSQLILPADPTNALGAATKQYVDTNGAKTDYQVFTASGTWTKPAGLDGNSLVFVEVWGAGGGGGPSGSGRGAGGGGAYNFHMFRASELSATVAVTVGAGGTGGNGATAGGTSTFGSYLAAYGGGGGDNESYGGGGGGWQGAGRTSTLGTGGAGAVEQIDVGGRGAYCGGSVGQNWAATNSVYGGGGGGATGSTAYLAGNSIYGGGGGGCSAGQYGTSVYGGRGGAQAEDGVAPGGGGGTAASGVYYNGARGECRVTVIGK